MCSTIRFIISILLILVLDGEPFAAFSRGHVALASTPVVHIDATRRGGRLIFSFKQCSGKYPVRIHGLIVSSSDEKERYCSLRTVLEGGERRLDSWAYPTTPAGFKQTMNCRPLAADAEYILSVVGSAAGTARFKIDGRGQVIVQSQSCMRAP